MTANPTATKEYVINQLPDVSGDITHHTIVNPAGIGTGTLHWYSVGKLTFGWWFDASGGTAQFFGSQGGGSGATAHLSADHLATLAGLPPIDTYYIGQNYGAYSIWWNGAGWSSDVPTNNMRQMVLGFLTT